MFAAVFLWRTKLSMLIIFHQRKENEVKLNCFVAWVLRKYSVMLPLYEHAHTRLFFFFGVIATYVFTRLICARVFRLFTCVGACYSITKTMQPGSKHQLNVRQIL